MAGDSNSIYQIHHGSPLNRGCLHIHLQKAAARLISFYDCLTCVKIHSFANLSSWNLLADVISRSTAYFAINTNIARLLLLTGCCCHHRYDSVWLKCRWSSMLWNVYRLIQRVFMCVRQQSAAKYCCNVCWILIFFHLKWIVKPLVKWSPWEAFCLDTNMKSVYCN